jgi:hypothetical protein
MAPSIVRVLDMKWPNGEKVALFMQWFESKNPDTTYSGELLFPEEAHSNVIPQRR